MLGYSQSGLTEEFEVRPSRHGDEEEIVQLLELVFDGWPHMDLQCSPLEHWMWKHIDNPFKKNIVMVAERNGGIIGTNHTILLKIKIGNDVDISGQATDLTVHPDFRGVGVRTQIRVSKYPRCERAGVKFYLAVSGNPIVIKSEIRRRNPRFPHRILNLVKLDDIDLQIEKMPVKNAWIKKFGYHTVKTMNKLRYAFTDFKHPNQDIKISEATTFDERINEFWSVIAEHYGYIAERSRDYLNWRYCDPRAGGFKVKIATEGSKVLGYGVLKINRFLRDYAVGFIVDLLVLPDQPDVASALVEDAVGYFEENDVNIVNALAIRGHPYEKVLKRHGFLDSGIRFSLFMRGIDKAGLLEVIESCPPSRAFYSWGDHDSLPRQPPRY